MAIPLVDLRAQYQSIKNEIQAAMQAVLEETAFIGGRFVRQFEESFAAYCKAGFCIGVGNGTDAIYIALRALGVGPGDEVITVANSFIATSEAITMSGATVVFVDCEKDTYNIDPDLVKRAITDRTKAIVAVHLYGCPANMTALMRIAQEHGLYVVEDAAQAHGAEWEGRRVGTLGHVACFSFYPGKNLGAYGDAGAIVTESEDLAVKCRMIANHGRVKKYDHEFEGVNSRLDGLQAAILEVKLQHLEQWTAARIALAHKYCALLSELCPKLLLPSCPQFARHVYHLFVVRTENREKIQSALKELGVETGIHYPIALPLLRAYCRLRHSREDFPIASEYSQAILSLPMFPELNDTQIEKVCRSLAQVIGRSD